jgi:hypothetical protein
VKASDIKWLNEQARTSGFTKAPSTSTGNIVYEDEHKNRVIISVASTDRNKLASSAALMRKYARMRNGSVLAGNRGGDTVDTPTPVSDQPINTEVIPMPEPAKLLEVRDPTPEQRFKIRSMLDKSFDDAAGMYLDGLDDQKVAEAAGVPRIIVERMRETAYGPVKITAEQAAAKAELASLRGELAQLATKISELEARLFPARKTA